MRKSGRLFIVLGVTLALVAAILAVVAFSDGSSKQAQGAEKGTVVVAAHDLAANKVLTQDDVETVEVDKSSIAPGTATDVSEVLNLAVNGDIVKGQRILKANLVTPSLTFTLDSGKRAVALPIDRINSVGGLIRPDDHIDLVYSTRVKLTTVLPTSPIEVQDGTKGYAKDDTLTLPPYGSDPGRTYPYPGEPGSRFTVTDSGDGNPVTKIVLQDIRVLRVLAGDVAIDSTGSPASEQSGGQNSDKDKNKSASGDKATGSDMLVLEVSPDQAEVIKFLQDNSGQYQVVLRPKDDHGKATTKGVTYDELVTDYGLTMPKSVRLPGGGR